MFKHASSDALSKIARVWLTISLLAVACMAVMLFFFAMPVWDDLVRASRPVEMGWWRYVIGFVYHHWQGRWASCGLESFVLPRVDITRFYWALIGAVAIVNAAGVYAICRWFTPLESRKTSAVISAGLLALLWAGIPSIAETVYWFTGAVENAMVLALAAILLTALLNFCGLIATKNLSYWMRIAALAIAAIVICGFHELYGSMLCLALGVGTIATFITPGTNKTAWIVVTIAASIGLAVVVLAPGNSARIASDGGHHSRQLGYDLRVAVKQAVHALPRWIIDPKLMAATVFVAFSPTLKINRRKEISALPIAWRWVLPLTWMLMLVAGFFAPSWAFGEAMPPRTLSGIYIVFVIGWLISVYLWSQHTQPKFPNLWARRQIISSLATIAFAIALIFPGDFVKASPLAPGNFSSVRRDLRERLHPWHNAVEKRYAYLRSATGTDALVTVLPKPPWMLLNGEVVNEPTDYRNWSAVEFFHLRSIRIQPLVGSPPPPPLHPTRPPGESKNN